jgi:dihydrofolate reductase
LITNQDKAKYPGADEYISGDLVSKIKLINTKYEKQDLFIIGGPKIIDQLFELVEEFYLTRIYGKFDCDKKINLKKIEEAMTLEEKIVNDEICHFEIWKR